MRPTVYVETTVVSYLVARPSRDLVTAAHQQITREWWDESRNAFEVFVSQAVVREASAGDPSVAALRLAALQGIPSLEITPEALSLAQALLRSGAVPAKAVDDALHIGIAAYHGVDYLLTWNVRHIANAQARRAVVNVCLVHGYELPIICNPGELMEVSNDVD
jgi:predicted nucleic acid-binding protein